MKLKMAVLFCHRMAVGHQAGVDMINLLNSEAAQGPSHHQEAVRKLSEEVMGGRQLHEAMTLQEPYFPRLVTAMTEVGESSGKLERAWFILAAHLDNQVKTRRAFLQSLAWPAFQLFAGIGVLSLVIWLMGMLTPAGGGEMTDILGLGLRGTTGVLKLWMYLRGFLWNAGLLHHGVHEKLVRCSESCSVGLRDTEDWTSAANHHDRTFLSRYGAFAGGRVGPVSSAPIVAR